MAFEFRTATRIVFGAGRLAEVPRIVAELGRAALLVDGCGLGPVDDLRTRLRAVGVGATPFSVAGEPTLALVRAATDLARGCDVVIGFGGGSAIDTAKAVAALLGNGGDPLDYLEVIGRGLPITRPSVPLVAIPTTAGTGAEVTLNAVLSSPEHQFKASMRSPHMRASAAIVDPMLLADLPFEVMAGSGLDAFAQLVEPFVGLRANPMIDALCRDGLTRSARSLRRACQGDRPAAVLEDLALASLFGG